MRAFRICLQKDDWKSCNVCRRGIATVFASIAVAIGYLRNRQHWPLACTAQQKSDCKSSVLQHAGRFAVICEALQEQVARWKADVSL